MDINSLHISCPVSSSGVKEGQYPLGWARVQVFSPELTKFNASPYTNVFIRFNLKKESDKARVIGMANKNMLLWDCTLASRPMKEDPVKDFRSVNASLSRCFIHDKQIPQINIVHIVGKILDKASPNLIRLGSTYFNPKAEDGQKEQVRRVIVASSIGAFGDNLPLNSTVFIAGELAGRNPITKEETPIVLASTIIPMYNSAPRYNSTPNSRVDTNRGGLIV